MMAIFHNKWPKQLSVLNSCCNQGAVVLSLPAICPGIVTASAQRQHSQGCLRLLLSVLLQLLCVHQP